MIASRPEIMKRKAGDEVGDVYGNGNGSGYVDASNYKRRAISDDRVRAAFRTGLFDEEQKENLTKQYASSQP